MSALTAAEVEDRRTAALLVRGTIDENTAPAEMTELLDEVFERRGIEGLAGLIAALTLGLAELLVSTAGHAGALATCDTTLLGLSVSGDHEGG